MTETDGIRNRFGKFVADPCIVIDFSDGSRWSTRDNLRDPDRTLNLALLSFLESKSGVTARHQSLERDLSTPGTIASPCASLQVTVRHALHEGTPIELRVGYLPCDQVRQISFYRFVSPQQEWKLDLSVPMGDSVCIRTRSTGGEWTPWHREELRWQFTRAQNQLDLIITDSGISATRG